MTGIELLRESRFLPQVVGYLGFRHFEPIHPIRTLLQVNKGFRLHLSQISHHPRAIHIGGQQHRQLHFLQIQIIQLHTPVNRTRIFWHGIIQQHLQISFPQQCLVYHSKPILYVRTVGIKTQFCQISLNHTYINQPLRVQLGIVQMEAIHLCLHIKQRHRLHTDVQLSGIQHRVTLMNRQNTSQREIERELQVDTLHRYLHTHLLTQHLCSFVNCKLLNRRKIEQHEKQQQ